MVNFEDKKQRFLKAFPSLLPIERVDYVISYGSAIFNQNLVKQRKKDPIIDMLVIVDDVGVFHEENYKMNREHYNSLYGKMKVSFLHKRFFPLFYFTYLEHEGVKYKYGVIGRREFERDMRDWEMLTVSGRLHKPVSVVYSKDDKLRDLLDINRITAVR